MFNEMTLDEVRDLAQDGCGRIRYEARCYLTRLHLDW
jgi:hypothetical protein